MHVEWFDIFSFASPHDGTNKYSDTITITYLKSPPTDISDYIFDAIGI